MSADAGRLTGVRRLAIDGAPIIHFIEAYPSCDAVLTTVFERISREEMAGMTSTITLTQVLSHPIRAGRTGLAGL